MIEKYLARIMQELKDVEKVAPSHLPRQLVKPIELDLLYRGVYAPQIPVGYPANIFEKYLGFRELKSPVDGSLNGMRLKVGVTTLHIKSQNDKNLESIALLYFNDITTKNISGAKAHTASNMAYVMLHENGVVSACCTLASTHALIAMVSSWYPDRMKGFGEWPYPNSKEEVSQKMQILWGIAGFIYQKTFSKIPDLVMLAVQTYKGSS